MRKIGQKEKQWTDKKGKKGKKTYDEEICYWHGPTIYSKDIIEKSVTRVTDRHHEACRVMPNSDPE